MGITKRLPVVYEVFVSEDTHPIVGINEGFNSAGIICLRVQDVHESKPVRVIVGRAADAMPRKVPAITGQFLCAAGGGKIRHGRKGIVIARAGGIQAVGFKPERSFKQIAGCIIRKPFLHHVPVRNL